MPAPALGPARSEAPQGSRVRAVSPAPVNRPPAGQVIALGEFAVGAQYQPFLNQGGVR